MRFVSVAGGHVTYEIEGRLWRSKYPYPGGLQNHVSAGSAARAASAIFERFPNLRIGFLEAGCGWAPMNRDAARNYGDFFNTYQFTGLFESMARRELRRDPTILD